jgi:hypothetical protein
MDMATYWEKSESTVTYKMKIFINTTIDQTMQTWQQSFLLY